MMKLKRYIYPLLIGLVIVILGTLMDYRVLEISSLVLEISFMFIIFTIVVIAQRFIEQKGIIFIGLSYLFVAIYLLLYVLGIAGIEFNNNPLFDYRQFYIMSRLSEITVFIIGFTILLGKTSIANKRVLQVGVGTTAIVVAFLLIANLYPQSDDVMANSIFQSANYTFALGYLLMFVLLYINRKKLTTQSIMLYTVIGLYLVSAVFSIIDLENYYFNLFVVVSRLSGLFLLLYYLHITGLKIPLNVLFQELEQSRDKLLEQSRMDELTGIPNRRYLFENLEKSFRLAVRERHSICCLMIDIDDFKGFNDTFGHLHGDSILKRIGSILEQASKRPLDLAGRYGGEEFLVVLPNTDYEGARIVCERILKSVRDLRIVHYKNKEKFLTVSIGFSSIRPNKENTVDEIVSKADEYLYKVKATGKDACMGIDINKGEL